MDTLKSVHRSKNNEKLAHEWSLFKILNAFAVELISVTDERELVWYVAREVVGKLGYVDCVIYLVDPDQPVLKQAAAIGEKNPQGNEIANLLEIPIGKGITGKVAKSQKPIIVGDLQKNKNYIPDLVAARSEICVPLIAGDQIIGVIDCEDPRYHHFDAYHLESLTSVAALTSAKLEIIRQSRVLSESERRHQIVFNSSLDGIMSIDTTGVIIECNPAAETMFGVNSRDIIGKTLIETIVPPELREKHCKGFQRFIDSGKNIASGVRMETLGVRADGDRFPLEITVTPYSIDGRKYLTGFLRDLSDVKKAEKIERASRETERRFSAFIEHLPSAFLIKDLDGHYLHVNSLWQRWFNPKGLDITGKTAFDILPPIQAADATRQDRLAAAQKKTFEKEVDITLANGKFKTLLLQKFPILDEEGVVVAIGGVSTDISIRKKMEEELRNALSEAKQASYAKSVFLSTMSHELRTPLNAILGFGEMLCGQYYGELGDKHYLEYARNIHSSGQHLLTLIEDVLDISSIELGVRDLANRSISLGDILEECINSIRIKAQKGGIHLTFETPQVLPKIFADNRAIKQIFLNLLTNSLKYCDAGDTVSISVYQQDERILVKISDTGVGIEEEFLSTLTEPFVRGHDGFLTAHEGVGLGLSIVKSLVEAHLGSLNIESEVGKGTTVTVALPL
ncbi:MAG: PAS domain S-box protein [Sneathiella sp.]|nr:PAS domain S-box protein [Sneathiella sp.]